MLRRARPFAILAGAWLVLLVYAFPGIMTRDSFDHLREARSGVYTDAHPPAVNLVFKICDAIVAGPFLWLVLQSSTFLVGLYALLRRTFEPVRAAWIAAAVFVFPPVMLPMAVIWKDNLMASLLVLGIVGLTSERRPMRLWGLAALVGATAFRYNALGATLPLIVLLFAWSADARGIRRYAIAVLAWLAVSIAGFGINRALTDREMHYWHSSLALHDIVGTLAYVDEDVPDAVLVERFAGTDLRVSRDIHATARALYSPRVFFPIVNDERRLWWMPINGDQPAPEAQRAAIARAWWETITSHPLGYVRHRLAVTSEVLGFGDHPAAGAVAKRDYHYPEEVRAFGLSTGWSPLQRGLTTAMRYVWRYTPLFLPFVYLIVALCILPLALRHRTILASLLSGLGMLGTLLLLAHSDDYRYSHWMVISTILGTILLFTERYRRRPQTCV